MSAPSFPVDDITLDALEHALAGAYTIDEDGQVIVTGADMSVTALLDFLSGYDPTKAVPLLNEYDQPVPDWTEYPDPIYHRDDVLRALIAEVRRLRKANDA